MIDEHEIKSKDFSLVLPTLVSKIKAVATGLTSAQDAGLNLSGEMLGFGGFLYDVADDLETINQTLYPKKNRTNSG